MKKNNNGRNGVFHNSEGISSYVCVTDVIKPHASGHLQNTIFPPSILVLLSTSEVVFDGTS